VYDVIVSLFLGIRAKFCLLATGQKLSVIYAGSNARKRIQGEAASKSPRAIYVHGGIHHPEVWSNQMYFAGLVLLDEAGTLGMNPVVLQFYKSIPDLGITLETTRIVERYSGMDDMTPEEIEDSRKRMMASRSKGGVKGGKVTQQRVRDINDAMGAIPDDVSEKDKNFVMAQTANLDAGRDKLRAAMRKKWKENVERYENWKEEHGREPKQKRDGSEEHRLAGWANVQRGIAKKGKLDAEQMQMLRNAKFPLP